ncbi:MAG: hypothetical protein HYZ00_13930 [Candidatus Hydrogenedentes bacterium]|nr:hypothetical protein [Candidatus Hydrogenedentota bacterium]
MTELSDFPQQRLSGEEGVLAEAPRRDHRLLKHGLLLVLLYAHALAWGQPDTREAQIGYLYPSGGQQGTEVQLNVGGQRLRGASAVHVTGEGVHASIVQYVGRLNLDGEQVRELARRLTDVWRTRQAELPQSDGGAFRFKGLPTKKTGNKPVTLPDHPLLQDLDRKSLRELAFLREQFRDFKKKQQNVQLAESVLLKVTIDPDAAPGERELRILTSAGLTNPLRFQVGLLPEVLEIELNDPNPDVPLPAPAVLDLPVMLNGQILPGDVDRFSFHAQRGQQLVIETRARRLAPYLADAVPGWFQPAVALYDAQGREVAFGDDYRFDPDPAFLCEIPADDIYELEVRDALYRGREDFVYRISLGEHPFVTAMFPLGGPENVATAATVTGWNLPQDRVPLNTMPGDAPIRSLAWPLNQCLAHPLLYAVDSLPEYLEIEPNDAPPQAQHLGIAQLVNGRISAPGDVDVFAFQGRGGQEIVAEVMARRLQSPLDSLLRLTDAAGNVVAWNDDWEDPAAGLLTHQADSYVRARLPQDGGYYLHLADAQRQGGEAYAYRLQLRPPQPDFALYLTPASLSVIAGRAVPFTVHAVRKDGFEGAIDLSVAEMPPGFTLDGGRIPAGKDQLRLTLSAPRGEVQSPVALHIAGTTVINGAAVTRLAFPAEDRMQAFIYQHLVPAQEVLVAVKPGRGPTPRIELGGERLHLPAGGAAEITVRVPQRPALPPVQFQLSGAPEGVTLQGTTVNEAGFALSVHTDADVVKAGDMDNLIIEAFADAPPGRRPAAQAAKQKRRVSLGALPAVPFEITPGEAGQH